MDSIKDIFVVLGTLLIGSSAIVKVHNEVKQAALTKVQHGLYPLSGFTNKLTCHGFDTHGRYMEFKTCSQSFVVRK